MLPEKFKSVNPRISSVKIFLKSASKKFIEYLKFDFAMSVRIYSFVFEISQPTTKLL